MNEYRILRDRHAALSDAIDRTDVAPPAGADRRLVQTFKESNYPTAADKFYACHPVALNGPESEGIAATPIVDTSTTLYVDFLRFSPPEGSYAVATAAGGRWVAEVASTPECGCGNTCGDISIPENDLTLTVVGTKYSCLPGGGNDGGKDFSFETPLKYYPAGGGCGGDDQWVTDCLGGPFGPGCVAGSGLAKFHLGCGLEGPQLNYYQYCSNGIGDVACPPSPGTAPFIYGETAGLVCGGGVAGIGCTGSGAAYQLLSATSSPFRVDYEVCDCSILTAFGACCQPGICDSPGYTYRSITITGAPKPPPPGKAGQYCVAICVVNCFGRAVPNARVAITDSSGNPIAAGNTGAGCCAAFNIGQSGTYTITIDSDDWPQLVVTRPLPCGRTTIALPPPAGDLCCGDDPAGPDGICLVPKEDLTLSWEYDGEFGPHSGTMNFVWYPDGPPGGPPFGSPGWYGDQCVAATPGPPPAYVAFTMTCGGGGAAPLFGLSGASGPAGFCVPPFSGVGICSTGGAGALVVTGLSCGAGFLMTVTGTCLLSTWNFTISA